MKSYSDSYKAAGVDVTAGYKSVELMKEHVKRTSIPGVVSGIGGFGGLFQPDMTGMKEPVLVSGTDGVGTKLVAPMPFESTEDRKKREEKIKRTAKPKRQPVREEREEKPKEGGLFSRLKKWM